MEHEIDYSRRCKQVLFTVWGLAVLLILAREPLLKIWLVWQ
jgi:hypothetical protein